MDLDGVGHRALASNIAVAMLAAAASLAIALALGWAEPDPAALRATWVLLFAAMGVARWNLTRAAEAAWLVHWIRGLEAWQARRWLGWLAVGCLVHPFTIGALGLGLAYHLILLVLALCVLWKITGAHPASAVLVMPMLFWKGIGALALVEQALALP